MRDHFEKKEALEHVIEKRTEGILSLSESHGHESSGFISSGCDALRETAIVFLLVWFVTQKLSSSLSTTGIFLVGFSVGWLFWKVGRSAWLGWFRLERLHRLIEQEKFEIEHHRPQEREELKALYMAKGFEGPLLEEVVDVLMADQDRLLKIMLEEELGLALQAYEHPLKQAMGAVVGVVSAFIISFLAFLLWPQYGIYLSAAVLIGVGAAISAYHEQNRVIQAIVWNLSIAILSFGIVYFFLQLFVK